MISSKAQKILDSLESFIEECSSSEELMEIQEKLDELSTEAGTRSDEAAEDEADATINELGLGE